MLLYFQLLLVLLEDLVQFKICWIVVDGAERRLDVELALTRMVNDLNFLLAASTQLKLINQLIDVEGLDRHPPRLLRVRQALLVMKIGTLLFLC